MPVVENQHSNSSNQRASRSVSFAEALVDPRQEESIYSESTNSAENASEQGAGVNTNTEPPQAPPTSPETLTNDIEDGTGKRFKIPFQEHRLRFDQKFPEGLDMRIPVSEFDILLEQIHREFIEPLDKSQKSVRKWSYVTAGTAPIGVGFVLSIWLARRVNRHQKALKNFWISLRQHLKALNRDIYYARGIEWRIEKDMEKITDRDAYNKLHAFRIEIVFRKPIAVRSGREIALRSIVESTPRTSMASSVGGNNQQRFSNSHFADPELFALLSTAPGGEGYSYDSNLPIEEEQPAEPTELVEDRTVYSSPFLIPDHMIVTDEETPPATSESLLLTVDEPSDVKAARVSSTFEPPSPLPAASIFSKPDTEESESEAKEEKKMTFADLLLSSIEEEKQESDEVIKGEEPKSKVDEEIITLAKPAEPASTEPAPSTATDTLPLATTAVATATALTAAMAAANLRSPSPPNTPELTPENPDVPSLETSDPARYSREEVFAQRQRKKFSRNPTLTTQLYDIPESPPLGSADPTGDAMNYLTQNDEDEDLIDGILGPSAVGVITPPVATATPKNFSALLDEMDEPKPVTTPHFDDLGPIPVAAYPMADPFSPLYETDTKVPLDPITESDYESADEMDHTDVDGDDEYVRRKKWRVAPENAEKLPRIRTMSSESIKPASRRSSYLPVTKTTAVRKTFDFTKKSDSNE